MLGLLGCHLTPIRASKAQNLKKLFDNLFTQRELLELEAHAIHEELTSPGINGEKPAGIKRSLVDE